MVTHFLGQYQHAASEHFKRIVPKIEALCDGGLHIEQFNR